MDQQRLLLESSPAYILVCLAVAGGIAFLLYRGKHPWSKRVNVTLTGIRFILVFILLFLLLGPIVKQIKNYFEKPLFVLLYDNSASVAETTDAAKLKGLIQSLGGIADELAAKEFEVITTSLSGSPGDSLRFNAPGTDLHSALKQLHQEYEGRDIAGVVLPSDGIYNSGLSPVHGNYKFPVYTVGVGDTSERSDILIRNISHNRLAYQGNKFPLQVEVQVKGMTDQQLTVQLLQNGKVIDRQTKTVRNNQLTPFDFQPEAAEQGIQKFDIVVDERPEEYNKRNNSSSVFVEVVEGKKKILLIAAAPHPDIKPISEVVTQNSNYDFLLHIPGVAEDDLKNAKPEDIDLVILHQVPDLRGRTSAIFQQFLKRETSLFLILGQHSDLRMLAQADMPINFDSPPREFDQVTPVINPGFGNFSLSPEASSVLPEYPPVSVHFGRTRIPLSASPILFQRVGSVSTEKPLLAVDTRGERKIGIMLGEGLWRWRLNEFDRTEATNAFDELFSKLIQYLSTVEDKRKFKSYPAQQDFAETESVVFESQVYNDIFEPVYGNRIELEIKDQAGATSTYNYVTAPGNTRYEIGGLKEGVYRYRSSTVIDGKTEEVKGQFAVIAREAELLNLTADFQLLRRLSANTGGRFYKSSETAELRNDLDKIEAKSVIHSEESYEQLVNLKWLFWVLLALVSVEWFARKFFGGY